ncbi:MAG: hypothetical protein DRJ52_06305 [Thermoprotei archaeon]|nr:MAG: hypothetical protein DRJ52_06305 [Thermoprotei archaeon]
MGLIKILHTADLHLGAGSTVGGKKRVEDFLSSFKRITEIALREEVDILLIAGDIFHTPRPSSNIFYSFAELTKRLFEKGVRIVAAAGNHDVPKSAEERSLIEALAEYSEGRFLFFKKPGVATITVKGGKTVAVVALPYLNPIQFILPDRVEESRYRRIVREKVAKLLEEIDADYRILLGHLMMEWATFGSEKIFVGERDIRVSSSDIFSHKFDYVALGHVHKPQSRDNMFYAGSIERIDFSEAKESKRVVLLEEENGSLTPKELRIPVRSMLNEVILLDDTSKISHEVYRILSKINTIKDPNEIMPPVLRLKLVINRRASINIKNIENLLRNKVYLVKIIVQYIQQNKSNIVLDKREKPLREIIKMYIKKICEYSLDLKDLEEDLIREALNIIDEVST